MNFLLHYWPHLTGGTILTLLGLIFREAISGAASKFGEWLISPWTKSDKVKSYKEKIVRADSRDKLHDFLARELVKVNDRLDGCEKRHQERDRKDEVHERQLEDCHKQREEAEKKAAMLRIMVNEADHKKAGLEARLARYEKP